MARVYSLFSGSQGNSTYISCGQTGILVDLGVSCRQLCERLAEYELHPEQVSAILVTHEHSDHIKGLPVFLKHHPVPVYATRGTLRGMVAALPQLDDFDLCPLPGAPFSVADVRVTAFATPHDSNESCGYRLELCDGRVASVCTDLGHVSETVREHLRGSDFVLLESNHDPEMLKNGSYPAYLKSRIAGMYGHLSNQACAGFLPELIRTGTTRVVLGHLSQENNTLPLALLTATRALEGAGYRVDRDCILAAATPRGLGRCFVL